MKNWICGCGDGQTGVVVEVGAKINSSQGQGKDGANQVGVGVNLARGGEVQRDPSVTSQARLRGMVNIGISLHPIQAVVRNLVQARTGRDMVRARARVERRIQRQARSDK